jgi:hypothetical protein
MQQLDHLLAGPVQVRAEPDQHLDRHSVTLTDQAKQDVLRANVVVAKLQRLAEPELEDPPGPWGERYVVRWRLLAKSDDLFDLLPSRAQTDAHLFQGARRDSLALANQPQQDVLRSDVIVAERPGFFLGKDDNPPRPIGEPRDVRGRRLARNRPDNPVAVRAVFWPRIATALIASSDQDHLLPGAIQVRAGRE